MYVSSLVLAAALALPAFVAAQSDTASSAAPTSTGGISPCILTCVSQAATDAGCSSFTDINCVCTSTTFQTSGLACIQSTCPASDLAAAQALQSQECANVSGAPSATSAASGSAASSSAASTSTSPASSIESSLSSSISSLSSSLSSRVSSITSQAGSITSALGGASSSSAAGSTTTHFGPGALTGAIFGVLGFAVGIFVV